MVAPGLAMFGCQMDRPGQVVPLVRQRTSLEEAGLAEGSAQAAEDHRLIPDRVELVVDRESADRVESEVPELVVLESVGPAALAVSVALAASDVPAVLVALEAPVALGVSAALEASGAPAVLVALAASAASDVPAALEELVASAALEASAAPAVLVASAVLVALAVLGALAASVAREVRAPA